MWQRVTDELGAEQRDALWSHFDLVPTSDDVDAPDALVARLRNPSQTDEDDAFDKALEDLLNDSTGARPHEDESGRVADDTEGGAGDEPGNDTGDQPR
jgi:hypothetical protein